MSHEISHHLEGIKGVDITTSGHLFSPQDTFALVHEINKDLPSDLQMEIELYTTLKRAPFAQFGNWSKKFGMQIPLPQGITAKDVLVWQKEYPLAKVQRVHLPFDYNNQELIAGLNKGNILDPRENRQILWMIYFGGAKNMHGIQLAAQLEVGINAHANVITGLALDNRLAEVKRNVPFIVTEVEKLHTTPLLRDQEAFGIPSEAVTRIVKRYGLDGILIGLDHLDPNVNLEEELKNEDVRNYTRAMHLAGENHAVLTTGDKKTMDFLQTISRTPFAFNNKGKVKATLDYNPLQIRKMSGREQIKLVKATIKAIMTTQEK